jgi:D-alanyl-D-alanine dipeptidase
LPYRQATARLRCVDDGRSPDYDRVRELPDAGVPWTSDEPMLRDDSQYRLTIYIVHNPLHVPEQGSCVFLHVWRAPAVATAGCTAMALADLRALVAWLDPAQQPSLVQLPRAEYRRLQRDWDLPALSAVAPSEAGEGKRK